MDEKQRAVCRQRDEGGSRATPTINVEYRSYPNIRHGGSAGDSATYDSYDKTIYVDVGQREVTPWVGDIRMREYRTPTRWVVLAVLHAAIPWLPRLLSFQNRSIAETF